MTEMVSSTRSSRHSSDAQASSCAQVPGRTELLPAGSIPPTSLQGACHSLISIIIRDEDLRTRVCKSSRSDAQLVVDYLDVVCREAGSFGQSEQRRILALLCKLAKSARVFPRYYKITKVEAGREFVGRGGFGDVRNGNYNGQRVCLKVFRSPKKLEGMKSMLATCAGELTLWAHLHHPNILPFYGVCLVGHAPCLVSPWMEKGNLREYLTDYPEAPRMPLALDILEGLSYLHEVQVIHSDLKSENILVSPDGRALITDFGVSCIAATSKLMSVTMNGGTCRWMAPELLTGDNEARATKSCDIWSFACLLYEILTTKLPFQQYKEAQVVAALVRKEIPLRPKAEGGIDDSMWELLQGCWNYTANDRPDCEKIQIFFSKMQIQGAWKEEVASNEKILASWEAVRDETDIEVEYSEVHEILVRLINTELASPMDPNVPLASSPIDDRDLDLLHTCFPELSTDKADEKEVSNEEEVSNPQTMIGTVSITQVTRSCSKEVQDVKTEDLTETDTVIVLMGPTGSGKSSFISSVAGVDRGVGHSLESCTSEVSLTRVRAPSGNTTIDIVLADTPGFDDTRKSDYEILELICKWFEQVGRKNILLHGILYLHRISDNRVTGTPLRCFEVFEKICGPQVCDRVVMVTTMWDTLEEAEMGQQRERELISGLWSSMVRWGSKTGRYAYTEESAWQILKPFIDTPKTKLEPVQLQKETVTLNRSLPQTDAGQELYNKLKLSQKKRRETIDTIREQIGRLSADQDVVSSLEEEYQSLVQKHEVGDQELRRLQVSFFQRFLKARSVRARYK